MPKARQRRRRKHRGTQAGTVERAAHNTPRGRAEAGTGQPRTRQEARAEARRRREERMSRPPRWTGSLGRAAVAAVIVAAVTILIGDATVAGGLTLGALSFLLYVPLGYALDRLVYRRMQRRRAGAGRGGGAATGG